jgi:hypothetical protein
MRVEVHHKEHEIDKEEGRSVYFVPFVTFVVNPLAQKQEITD